jgi:hypothetical protein
METELEPIEAGEGEESDTFQNIIAIMIAIVSLVGAVVAWQASLPEPDDADREGLQATLNAETTRFLNNAELYQHYRAYTAYTLNDTFGRQLEADLTESKAEAQPELVQKQAEAADLAGTSQLFFPARYLNRDGSYNIERELGEAWAQAGQRNDLNSQPYFDRADAQRTKAIILIAVIIGLTISLLFYTLAEGLHPGRQRLRWLTTIGGTLFLIGGIIASLLIEVWL